jgi:hypothetical protein
LAPEHLLEYRSQQGKNKIKKLARIAVDIVRKVTTATKANAAILTQQSGIEPSLSDEEIHQILSQVVIEIRRKKERDNRP